MFQIISAAIAGAALVAAYAAAWRIYRSAWDRKATAELGEKRASRVETLSLLFRRRRLTKARRAGATRTRDFAKA
jgi:hypothetical protein